MKQQKIIAYKVVYAVAVDALSIRVSDCIDAGWQPFGSVAVTSHMSYQAIVKYEKKEPREDLGPG